MFLADWTDLLEVTLSCEINLVVPSPCVQMSKQRSRETQLRVPRPIPRPG